MSDEVARWRHVGATMYGPFDAKKLWARTPEEWLVDTYSPYGDEEAVQQAVGDRVTVCAYARTKISDDVVDLAADAAVDAAIEQLWGAYGDPDEPPTYGTFIPARTVNGVRRAFNACLQLIVPQVQVWDYECIGKRGYTADEVVAILREYASKETALEPHVYRLTQEEGERFERMLHTARPSEVMRDLLEEKSAAATYGKALGVVPLNADPEPSWKKGCPPSKLLVLAWQGHVEVLEGFGPEVYYMQRIDELNALNAWVEGIALDDGVWELEIAIRSWRSDTLDGTEYDEELVVLSTRPAPKEVVQAHFNGEQSWDTGLWVTGGAR